MRTEPLDIDTVVLGVGAVVGARVGNVVGACVADAL